MLDPIDMTGLAKTAKLVLDDNEVHLPNVLFLDGYQPYQKDDVLLDTGKGCDANLKVLWEGNPLLNPPISSNGEHLFSIPAHIPFPPSVNSEKGHHFLKHSISDGQDLFILLNGVDLIEDPKKLAEVLAEMQELAGPQDIVYTPGLGEPAHVAVLAYLGVDLFDSQPVVKLSLMGKRIMLGSPGTMGDDRSFEEVLASNYSLLRNEITTVREAVRTGELRNLVEERANADVNLMALLRTFDERHYGLLERDLPISGKGTYRCISRESLNRPGVRRWRDRLEKRYSKPPSASVLLLLPCSARKPYSFSKSHKMFRNALQGLDGLAAVHEVVITSPLGVVPKDLELFHPANSYDIPVIGLWDSNEKEMIKDTLRSFLEKNAYDQCICHFPDREIVEPVLKERFGKISFTCEDGRPTSEVSLWNLAKAIEGALENAPRTSKVVRKQEDMLNRFGFQFTNEFTEVLPDFKVLGRYPNLKAVADDRQIGMYVLQRGGISLTLKGAQLLARSGKYVVKIDDFVPKGTVFSVGVLDATDDIRPGDEVVLVHDDQVRGCGTAVISGRQMRLLSRGPAVSVRHHS